MEKTYNARLFFKGEGSFTFTLPGKGEVTIYNGKDIYVKGLSISTVEYLRELRPLLLDHKLNANSAGCYSVIDLTNIYVPKRPFIRAIDNSGAKSLAELKSELIKPEDLNSSNEMNNLVDNLVTDMQNNKTTDTENTENTEDNKSDEKLKDTENTEDNKSDEKLKDTKKNKLVPHLSSRGKGRSRR